MNKNKYLLLFLIGFISQLVSTEWTILIYMAADNGLHEYALQDIAEMELSSFGSEANIIVQMDGAADSDLPRTYRYKISQHAEDGIQSASIANLGEVDSGSYLTLKSFVEWGFNRYKSEKKALIIWSHANGWAKDISGKGIAPDNTSETFISMSEHQMQKALSNTHLDILIYDACNMQTIENLVEVKEWADYIIGSEATVPVTGLPYAQIFDYWSEATNIDSLVANIPLIYVDAYRPGNLYNSGPYFQRITSSTAKMEDFATLETSLNSYLNIWSNHPDEFIKVREALNEFGISYTDIDLKELLQYLSLNSDNEELVNDSEELYQQLLEIFISYDSSSFDYSVGPASIWFPKYSYQFMNNWQIYRNLDFAQGEIGNFLNQFLAPDEIHPFPFEITKTLVLNETIFIEWENHLDPDQLTYYLNFNFADNTSQEIIIQNEGYYEGLVQQNGEFYLVAVDASENRTKSETVKFQLPRNYGKIYCAPNPAKSLNDAKLIIYDTNIAGKEAEVKIFTISGKEICKKTIILADNQNEHKLALSELISKKLSSGIYLCLVKIEDRTYKTKLAIEY